MLYIYIYICLYTYTYTHISATVPRGTKRSVPQVLKSSLYSVLRDKGMRIS